MTWVPLVCKIFLHHYNLVEYLLNLILFYIVKHMKYLNIWVFHVYAPTFIDIYSSHSFTHTIWHYQYMCKWIRFSAIFSNIQLHIFLLGLKQCLFKKTNKCKGAMKSILHIVYLISSLYYCVKIVFGII